MKKIGIALCILTILCGCTSAGTPEEVLEDDQEVQETQEMQDLTPEEHILAASNKLFSANSFDVESLWEATPCNDFYNHSKTTLNGTVSDVENMVFDGYYYNAYLDKVSGDGGGKANDLITEGPITKKAGEDAILPAEYNGGYEFSLGNLYFEVYPYIYQKPGENEKSKSLEYSVEEEETENGIKYTIQAKDEMVYDDGTPIHTQMTLAIYEIDEAGYLTYAKVVTKSPFITNDGEMTDIERTMVNEKRYTNIQ